MKIAIASDHGGYKLKEKILEYLKEKNIEFQDFGTHAEESCDYPEYAKIVSNKIVSNEFDKGILICGTGIGMAIVANKIKGIRAAVCTDSFSAKSSRTHNNTNVLCLGQRITGEGLALNLLDIWLSSEFEGGRHKNRVDMFE